MNLRKLTPQFAFQDVVAQLRTCKTCQKFRRRRPIDPLGTVADPTKPGEVITCDFLGWLPKGHGSDRYILSITDYLSRWPAIGISSAANTSTLIEGLEKWISHFGKPRIILCDPVSYQISRRFQQCLQDNRIEVQWTVLGSHKSNGLIERFHQTLIGRIRRLLTEDAYSCWEETLQPVLQAIRTTPNRITGYTPEEAWNSAPPIWQ